MSNDRQLAFLAGVAERDRILALLRDNHHKCRTVGIGTHHPYVMKIKRKNKKYGKCYSCGISVWIQRDKCLSCYKADLASGAPEFKPHARINEFEPRCGYCKCGCGSKTRIAAQNLRSSRLGMPQFFLRGHSGEFEHKVSRGILPPGVVIDEADRSLIQERTWSIGGPGYVTSNGRKGKYGSVTLHRFLMNPPKGFVVDHINGNRLDNRRANLRIVRQKLNAQNQRLSRLNSTGFIGVSFVQRRSDIGSPTPYRAYARIGTRQKHLGYYATAEEAAQVSRRYREDNYEGFIAERHAS